MRIPFPVVRGAWRSVLLLAVALASLPVGSFGLARSWTLAPGEPWPELRAGDQVRLAPGGYEGPWEIAVPDVTVRADGAVLRGPAEGSSLILAAPGIAVHGLTVRDAGRVADLYAPDAAAWLLGCDGCVLDGLDARGVPAGVRIEGSEDVRIRNAQLVGGPDGPGVTAYQAPGLHLSALEVEGFLDGLYVERSDGTVVRQAQLHGAARYGLHLMFSAGVTIEDAVVEGGGVGSAVMYGRDARIVTSRFAGHEGPLAYGLLLHEMHGVEVDAVTLDGNTVGALIVSSPDVRIGDATIARSGTGLLVRRTPQGASSAVVVRDSRFTGNVGDVAVDDPDASVRLEGNAYDAASRLDLDRDGVADAPYLPTSTFALLATRTPDLSLFTFQPGVTLWERAEASVPGLRLASLHDPRPRPLARDGDPASRPGRVVAIVLIVAAATVAGAAGRPGRRQRLPRSPA